MTKEYLKCESIVSIPCVDYCTATASVKLNRRKITINNSNCPEYKIRQIKMLLSKEHDILFLEKDCFRNIDFIYLVKINDIKIDKKEEDKYSYSIKGNITKMYQEVF